MEEGTSMNYTLSPDPDSPMLLIPARPLPDTKRTRLAPVYKRACFIGILLYSILLMVWMAVMDFTFQGHIPAVLQYFFITVSAGSGGILLVSLYFIFSAGTDVKLRNAFRRSGVQQLYQFPVKTALAISKLWFFGPHDQITYVPSTQTLLEILQPALAPSTEEKTPQHDILEPIKEAILCLSDSLTLLLIGCNGTRAKVSFPLDSYRTALILYLGIVGRKNWVLTGILKDTVYYLASRSTFSADIRTRINDIVVNAAQLAGLEPFQLFQSGKSKRHWAWRLTVHCTFKDIDQVHAWSREIAAIRAGEAPQLPLEDLRRRVAQIMRENSELSLMPFFDHAAYKLWAKDAVKELRQKRRIIVEYAAEQEFEAWKEDPAHEEVSLRQAAQYYEWCMQTAMTITPDILSGSHYQKLCVRMYRLLHDDEAVAGVEEHFRKLKQELPPDVQ